MSAETLPVIDIRDLRRAATHRAIDAACREWGFFQVVGHGIDERTLAALRREMRAFFALPLSAKHAIMRTAENPWGFYDRELTKRTRDWKQVYDYGPPDGRAIVPQLPRELPEFAPAIARFYARVRRARLRAGRSDRGQSRHAAGRARCVLPPGPYELSAAQLLPAVPDAGAASRP